MSSIDTRKNLMFMAESAVGSGFFASLYVRQDEGSVDVLEGGRVACARFVSVILHSVGLLVSPHATVDGTIRDMEESGWRKVGKPLPGAVIVWEPDDHDGSVNRHIGFFMGDGLAVSNSTSRRVIAKHHWTFGEQDGTPVRKIESVYWHDSLN